MDMILSSFWVLLYEQIENIYIKFIKRQLFAGHHYEQFCELHDLSVSMQYLYKGPKQKHVTLLQNRILINLTVFLRLQIRMYQCHWPAVSTCGSRGVVKPQFVNGEQSWGKWVERIAHFCRIGLMAFGNGKDERQRERNTELCVYVNVHACVWWI